MPSRGSAAVPVTTILALFRNPDSAEGTGSSHRAEPSGAAVPATGSSRARTPACLRASCSA